MIIPRSFLYLLALTNSVWIVCSDNISDIVNGDQKLILDLIKNSDHGVRPFNNGPPVNVKLGMYLLTIREISEVDMSFTTSMILREHWRDPRLQHNSTKRVVLDGSIIRNNFWVPDLSIMNSCEEETFHKTPKPNELMYINSDGFVYYTIKITVRATCNMDLRKFPFDDQDCALNIMSYAYDVNDCYLELVGNDTTDAIVLDPTLELSQFYLEKVHGDTGIYEFTEVGNFSYVLVSFHLQRQLSYYFLNAYIPTGAFVIIAWLALWIPPTSSPARVTLGITCMLTLVTKSTMVKSEMPKVAYVMQAWGHVSTASLYSIASSAWKRLCPLYEAKWRMFLCYHVNDFINGAEIGLVEGYAPIHRPKILSFDDARYCKEVLISPGRSTEKYPTKATLLAFKKLENIYAGILDLKDWLYNLLHRQLVEYIAFEKREAMQKDDELETHEDRHREAVESFQDWPIERRLRTEKSTQMLHPDLRNILHEYSRSKRYGMLLSHIAYAIECSKNVLMILGPSKNMWQHDADTRVMSKENGELSSALECCRDSARKLDDEELEGNTFTKWPVSLGYIGCDGGMLQLQDANIHLYVPQDIVSANVVQEVYIALETGDVLGYLRKENEEGHGKSTDSSGQFVTVSPVVRVAPRYLRFDEPVMLTLPHCARNVHASKFRLAYSYHRIGKRCNWRILSANETQMVVREDKVTALVTRGGCYQVRLSTDDDGDKNSWKVLCVGLFSSPMRDFMRPDHLTLQLRIWNDTPADRKVQELMQDENKQFHLSDIGYIGLQKTGRHLDIAVTAARGWTVSQDAKTVTRESLMSLGAAGGCQAGFYYCRKVADTKSLTPRSTSFKVHLHQLRTNNRLALRCDGQTDIKQNEFSTGGASLFKVRPAKGKVIEGTCGRPVLTSKIMDALSKGMDRQSDMIVMVEGKAKCMDYRYLARELSFNVSVNKYWDELSISPRRSPSAARARGRRRKLGNYMSGSETVRNLRSLSADSSLRSNYRKRIGERLRASSVVSSASVCTPESTTYSEGLFASDGCRVSFYNRQNSGKRRTHSAARGENSVRHRYYPSIKNVYTYSIGTVNGEVSGKAHGVWVGRRTGAVQDPNHREHGRMSSGRVNSGKSNSFPLDNLVTNRSVDSSRSISCELRYPSQNNIRAYIEKTPRDEERHVYIKMVKRQNDGNNEDDINSEEDCQEDDEEEEREVTNRLKQVKERQTTPRWKNPTRRLLNIYISEGLQSEKCRAEIAEALWQKMADIGNTHAQNILYPSTTLQLEQVPKVANVISRVWPSVARHLGSDEDEIATLSDKAKIEGWNRRTTAEVYLHGWLTSMSEREARPALVDFLSAVSKTETGAAKILRELL
ncbi:uncharacterized protein [Ptychodera flava]|uniref:uncharacterized protein n=1 Tax=Ptychodera flava TaxID=63121 RepID=UPI003969E9BD